MVGGAGPSVGHTVVLSNRTSLFITVLKTKDLLQVLFYQAILFLLNQGFLVLALLLFYVKKNFSGLRDGSGYKSTHGIIMRTSVWIPRTHIKTALGDRRHRWDLGACWSDSRVSQNGEQQAQRETLPQRNRIESERPGHPMSSPDSCSHAHGHGLCHTQACTHMHHIHKIYFKKWSNKRIHFPFPPFLC